MTAFDDEVDPFEAEEKTPSPYLDEEVDAFDAPAPAPDDEDEDLDDEDDEDELEDATEEEIDVVVALYREDGEPVAVPLAKDLANDLDELVNQLRRMPGDGGAVGMVSIAGEFFVLCRVRGRKVQLLLSDAVAGNDWPIARDVLDMLDEDVPDPDDESEAAGDLSILADQGVSELDMEGIADNLDEDSDELLRRVAQRMRLVAQYDRAVAAQTEGGAGHAPHSAF